ncbi:MAG: hypothetical protein Tsb0034_29360 [Ekhidna sp.]
MVVSGQNFTTVAEYIVVFEVVIGDEEKQCSDDTHHCDGMDVKDLRSERAPRLFLMPSFKKGVCGKKA